MVMIAHARIHATENGEREMEACGAMLVLCPECGAPVADETLECLSTQPEITVVCYRCGGDITLKITDLDRVADALIYSVQEFRARNLQHQCIIKST